MRTRQAKKILRYYNGGTRHKLNLYWYTRTLFYHPKPKGWLDHRITKALKIYQRHGRVRHPLAQH